MSVARTIARNTTFNSLTTVVELVITFVTGIVLARNLGAEQYGLYSYLMWFISLAVVIVNLGLGEMSKRFIAEAVGRNGENDPVGFAQLSLVLRTMAALFVAGIIIISSGYWSGLNGGHGNQTLFILAAVAVFPHVLQHTFIPIFRGFQKSEYVMYVILATYPLRLGLIIAIMAMGFGVFEVLILHISILTLGTLVGFFFSRRLLPLKKLLSVSLLPGAVRKRALKYALTVSGVLVLDFLAYQNSAVFFIGLYCPVEEVGFYTLACKFGMLLGILPNAFAFVLLPAVAEQYGKGDTEKIKKIFLTSIRYLMLAVLPLAAGGIALSNSIILLLYGADFTPAVMLTQVILFPMAMFTIGHAAGAVIYAINRPDFILKMNLILAVFTIGLCLLLIPRYGVLGAIIACSIPRILNAVIGITFAARKIEAAWPIGDAIKVTLVSVIMGAAVYFLQSQLGVVSSLVVGIPSGIAIYLIGIFALKVIREQDVILLKGAKYSMPLVLRKYYSRLMGCMERIVVGTKLSTE